MCQLGTPLTKTVCPGEKQCATGTQAQPNYTPGDLRNLYILNEIQQRAFCDHFKKTTILYYLHSPLLSTHRKINYHHEQPRLAV